MQATGYAARFAIVLLVALGANGSSRMEPSEKAIRYTCHPTEDIHVIDTGTKPKAIYLCKDTVVNWKPDGHIFSVDFVDYPFENPKMIFDNTHLTTPKMRDFDDLTVFKFYITVDGHTFDPHVVGGGGIVLESKADPK